MQFFHGTNIDFIGKRFFFFLFSSILTIGGIIAVAVLGVKYGIDFEGGSELIFEVPGNQNIAKIRTVIDGSGVEGSEVKQFGEANRFSVRIKASKTDEDIVKSALIKAFTLTPDNFVQENTIGPKVGNEMKTDALMAILLAMLAMLVYIAFRFEFVFGLGAIVALAHDVIVTFSMLVIFHHLGLFNLEMNVSILAGMLTVIGFSINDTVIIFDRVRENKTLHKTTSTSKLFNISVNETLSRTINTVLTVLMVLVTMMIFGGPVLEGFAFTMFLGIIFGTYSSIYIASSFVIWYMQKVQKVNVEGLDKKEALKTA